MEKTLLIPETFVTIEANIFLTTAESLGKLLGSHTIYSNATMANFMPRNQWKYHWNVVGGFQNPLRACPHKQAVQSTGRSNPKPCKFRVKWKWTRSQTYVVY
jgi:hypothetical protein